MGDPLRILQIYPKGDYFTGAAVQLRELAAGLAARGHEITVATAPSPAWSAHCRRAALEHVALPMQRAWDLRTAWRLARLIRARRIQLAHAHKGRARTLLLLAGWLGGRTVLVLNRGVSFPLGPANRLGYTSRRVHAVVAVCDSIKRRLVASGVPERKIAVIYSGTDLDRFHGAVDGSRIRRDLGLGAGDFLITQIGVRSWRGWADVLEAFARLAPAAPEARLLFVGAPTPRVVEILERARNRGLDTRVQVLGHRDDVPAILAASDVVVDASWAGLGLTGSIREALACERPVIATALEGMPELITDAETGLLVPPRDPDALARALSLVLAEPARAQAMARAGRKRVEAHFSLRAKLDATEALYHRLVAAHRAS
jgi:glycosyltransferase involved in cell wall biosynthesis